MKTRNAVWAGLCLVVSAIPDALADGTAIGKVYLPYVNPLEKEVEYWSLLEHDNPEYGTDVAHHSVGFGSAVASSWFAEMVVTYIDEPGFEVENYELEVRHQLTEQGEFDSDWGVMMELEKLDGEDGWEMALGLLNTREWQRWQFTTNLFLIQEWGEDVNDELETALSFQSRYRLQPSLEPGIELFLGEDTRALGPMVTGLWRLSGADSLRWQVSLLFGSGDTTADENLKFELDYEFY